MPNRIIRPGINDSERVNMLDWQEEVFYRRLLNVIDDHGLWDARIAKLRADLYPLKLDRVREADISRWIAACEKAGLIVLYEVAGKRYLWVLDTRWQVRSEPKFPLPPPEVVEHSKLRATDINCAQLRTQSLSETLSETESKTVKGTTYPPGLLRVWAGAPDKARERSSRNKCLVAWRRLKLEPQVDAVLAGLEAWKKCDQWQKESGQFVLGLHRWLTEQKFLEHPAESHGASGGRNAAFLNRVRNRFPGNGVTNEPAGNR